MRGGDQEYDLDGELVGDVTEVNVYWPDEVNVGDDAGGEGWGHW